MQLPVRSIRSNAPRLGAAACACLLGSQSLEGDCGVPQGHAGSSSQRYGSGSCYWRCHGEPLAGRGGFGLCDLHCLFSGSTGRVCWLLLCCRFASGLLHTTA